MAGGCAWPGRELKSQNAKKPRSQYESGNLKAESGNKKQQAGSPFGIQLSVFRFLSLRPR